MKRLALGLALLTLSGCLEVSGTGSCPQGTATVTVGGNTLGTQLLALGTAAGKASGLFAAETSGSNVPQPGVSYSYKTLAIFGSDSVTYACAQQNQSPLPVAIVSQPVK